MKLRRSGAVLLALAVILNVAFLPPAQAMAKRKVAVMPFNTGTYYVANVDLGQAIASMLVTNLVKDGTYTVIDRELFDTIMKEQNFSVSDRADPATACKIGKSLSVDAMIVGKITQFGSEHNESSASLPTGYIPGVPYVGGLGGLFGSVRSSKHRTRVSIDVKMVDVNTMEVIGAAQGTGESSRKGGGFAGMYSSSYGSDSAIADEATIQAVDSVTTQLLALANKIPDNQSLALKNVQGKIADVTGNTVIVNVGKNNGLKSGDNLQVEKVVKTIKDPDSGRVLKEVTNTVAVISLTQVENDSATGTLVKGSGVKVGDSVKKCELEVSAIVVQPTPGADLQPTRSMSATGTLLNKGTGATKSVTK